MAEPSETPPDNLNYNNNPNVIATIHPATKLGGRGTPRRKMRRSTANTHSAVVAARTLESKLKPFRSQYQLYDQQELCDVTILYEDGHLDIHNQVHIHSTRSFTMHEIDSSEAGTQTYHIDELDSSTSAYLMGNVEVLHEEIDRTAAPPAATARTSSTNYYQDLQQRQYYTQSSPYYMTASNYQPNPYAYTSFDSYSQNIHQVYGGVNEHSDDEEESATTATKSKRRRRRHKHAKAASEPSASIIPSQETPVQENNNDADDDDDEVTEKATEDPENDMPVSTKTKRKRRRVRKSKKSSITGEPTPSSIIIEQPSIDALETLPDERTLAGCISPSRTPSTPGQHTDPQSSYPDVEKSQPSIPTKNSVHESNAPSREDGMNVFKHDEREEETDALHCSTRTTDIPDDQSTSASRTQATSISAEVQPIAHPVAYTTTPPATSPNNSLPVIIIHDHDDDMTREHVSDDNHSDLDQVSASSATISSDSKQ